MGCKNYCLYGQNACCLECQIKDQCNIQCDDMDSYEYAVECPDHIKVEEDEQQEKYTKISPTVDIQEMQLPVRLLWLRTGI